jgi:hypothetical protein
LHCTIFNRSQREKKEICGWSGQAYRHRAAFAEIVARRESGAKDTRSPNASPLPSTSNLAKRLECGAFTAAFLLRGAEMQKSFL